jgi:hypothetical protein
LAAFAGERASAQEKVRVGWAAMTSSHTPLWVAQEKGFLAKQRLSVESIFFGAGPPAMQALVAGDLDIVVTSAPNVVNPRFGGADTVMILSIIPMFIDHIVSAPNITTAEQLRGKIGSVNRFGSISERHERKEFSPDSSVESDSRRQAQSFRSEDDGLRPLSIHRSAEQLIDRRFLEAACISAAPAPPPAGFLLHKATWLTPTVIVELVSE